MPKKPLKCCLSFIISLVILITAFTSISNAYQIKSINGQYVSGPLNGWISFQSWSGFTQETRWAIDYSARQWNNRTGITTLYHSATQHNTNIRQAYDGKNLITKVSFGNLQCPTENITLQKRTLKSIPMYHGTITAAPMAMTFKIA